MPACAAWFAESRAALSKQQWKASSGDTPVRRLSSSTSASEADTEAIRPTQVSASPLDCPTGQHAHVSVSLLVGHAGQFPNTQDCQHRQVASGSRQSCPPSWGCWRGGQPPHTEFTWQLWNRDTEIVVVYHQPDSRRSVSVLQDCWTASESYSRKAESTHGLQRSMT